MKEVRNFHQNKSKEKLQKRREIGRGCHDPGAPFERVAGNSRHSREDLKSFGCPLGADVLTE